MNQPNTVKLALGGVVASLAVALATSSFSSGTADTSAVVVTAKNATGATIVGNENFESPIALSTTDSTGAFTLSTPSLALPGSVATLAYSGANGATTVDVRASVAGFSIVGSSRALVTKFHVKYGVFIRPNGGAPYGMFTTEGSGVLDANKTRNILDIGAKWGRGGANPYYIDKQIFSLHGEPISYDWKNFDTVTSWEVAHGIEPVIGIDDGPVQLNDDPTVFRPHTVRIYPTPQRYAAFCTETVQHALSKGYGHSFSIPSNEVQSDTSTYPLGQDANNARTVAPYAIACYRAIKAVDPSAFVWGMELNGDGGLGTQKFVQDLRASFGCGPRTCYDGLSTHTSLRYPDPPAGTPCYPHPGGDYTLACIDDIIQASGDPTLPIMIGETGEIWPNGVKDAAEQALAAPLHLRDYATHPNVRYVAYADLDECGLYAPPNFFMNGCLVDINNNHVPAWEPVHQVFLGN